MANTLSTTTVMSTTMVMTSHSMMGNITLPGSDNETIADTKEDYSPIFSSKFVGSLYILIGCMGITGNLLVVYVFANAPSLRKNLINMYIINQSCIDATVSVFLIAISRLTSDVPYSGMAGVLYCRIWQSRFHVWGLLTSSTYNLIALTLERYTEIVYPIWHKIHFSRNKAIISMVCIWLFGLTWEGAGKITPTHIVDGKCSLYTKWPNQIARKILGFNVVIIKLIIPLVVMVFAYSKIAWVLQKKLSENITYNQSTKANGKEHRLAKGKKNTIKTLFIVTVAFFLCWSWNQVVCHTKHHFIYNINMLA